MNRRFLLVSAAAMIAAAVPSASAHHSHSDFDVEQMITVYGKLVSVRFRNPHVRMEIEVTHIFTRSLSDEKSGAIEMDENGFPAGEPVTLDEPQIWKVSGPSPIDWTRDGWRKSDLEEGAEVTLTGFVPKDEGKQYTTVNLFMNADGKIYDPRAY